MASKSGGFPFSYVQQGTLPFERMSGYAMSQIDGQGRLAGNPYRPTTFSLPIRSVASTPARFGVGVCIFLVSFGCFVMLGALVLIVANGREWVVGDHPLPIKALMVFVVVSLGAIPGVFGFGLQYFARQWLRSLRERSSESKHGPVNDANDCESFNVD